MVIEILKLVILEQAHMPSKFVYHYANRGCLCTMQYTEIFTVVKLDNFQTETVIFFLSQKIAHNII